MTVEPTTTPIDDRPTRSAALELARLHLRTGALALARTELETLAGRDLLDDAGILDLAEVRWRTGDVAGAGEAVAALLDGAGAPDVDDGVSPIAWVIAAEAAAARGRPTEARHHADRVRSTPGGTIDAIFAGLPRSSAWPADPLTLAPSDATLFPATGKAGSPGPGRDGGSSRPAGSGSPSAPPVPTVAGAAPGAPGFWDADDPSDIDDAAADELPEIDPELAAVAEAIAATEALAEAEAGLAPSDPEDAAVELVRADAAAVVIRPDADDLGDLVDDDPEGPDPAEALEEGRLALEDGQTTLAAMHLGLALRLAPALAPAVLDVLGEADAPELAFVRGDAYRLVGREREARRAYGRARSSTRIPSPDARIDAGPAPAGAVDGDDPDHDATQGDPT